MRYVAGFNSTELSAAIGLTPSGTRNRLERLLSRLRLSSTETYVAEVGDETTYFDDATGTLLRGDEVRAWLGAFEGLIPPLAMPAPMPEEAPVE